MGWKVGQVLSVEPQENRRVAIYGLICPVRQRVVYVGRAIDPHARLVTHAKHWANGQHVLGSLYGEWANEMNAAGFSPQMVILDESDECNADYCESQWIAKFGIFNGNKGNYRPTDRRSPKSLKVVVQDLRTSYVKDNSVRRSVMS